MFRNAEHGVFGLQGEALAAGCRDGAHKTEASIALRKLEKTQDVVQTLLSELSKVREEQVATSHHCEFLTTELKAERSAAVAAAKTWRNPRELQETRDLNALGTELSEQMAHITQQVEDLSSESWGRFEELRLAIEHSNEKRRLLTHSVGEFQSDLQILTDTVEKTAQDPYLCGNRPRREPTGCELPTSPDLEKSRQAGRELVREWPDDLRLGGTQAINGTFR